MPNAEDPPSLNLRRDKSGPASALMAGWPVAVGGRPGGGQRAPGQPPLRLALIPPLAWRGHVPSDGTGGESPSAAKRRKRRKRKESISWLRSEEHTSELQSRQYLVC